MIKPVMLSCTGQEALAFAHVSGDAYLLEKHFAKSTSLWLDKTLLTIPQTCWLPLEQGSHGLLHICPGLP